MDWKILRTAYKHIVDGTATKEDRRLVFYAFSNLGGMSLEWFYSLLVDDFFKEPTNDEISTFLNYMKTILLEDI